jgi:G:T-mismatch repair DNA endonuclease (very short patch repair protein)
MADVHDKATRSYNMSQIKGKDTKEEMLVNKLYSLTTLILSELK